MFSHPSLTSIQAILILAQHEHDLPLEHTASNKSAAYPRNVFVGLYRLELLRQ